MTVEKAIVVTPKKRSRRTPYDIKVNTNAIKFTPAQIEAIKVFNFGNNVSHMLS